MNMKFSGFCAFALVLGLVACGEDGKNGVDGAVGAQGVQGEAGASCTATPLKDGSGYKLVCGDEEIGVIKNGDQGNSGEDGKNCEVEMDGDKLTIICPESTVTIDLNDLVKSSSSVAPAPSSSSIEIVSSSDAGNASSSSVISENLSSQGGEESSSSEVSSSSEEVSSSSVAVGDGTVYDPEAHTLTDGRDGSVYKTVTIGEGVNAQVWMAENLRYAYTGVPYKSRSFTSDSTSWCFEDNIAYCTRYGRLYTWSAVMDSAARFSENAGTACGYGKTCTPNTPHRGICPKGWHVPTNEEYSTLYDNTDGIDYAAMKLKTSTGWFDNSGTDEYGFSILPAGYIDDYGNFNDDRASAFLWSTTEYNGKIAFDQGFYYYLDEAYQEEEFEKNYGFSLRCLKDSN